MKSYTKSKCGYSLVITLFMLAAMSMMMTMLIRIGQQRLYTTKRLVNQVKALAYAEAGVDYAYSILSADFSQRNNPSAFALNGGSGTVGEEGFASGETVGIMSDGKALSSSGISSSYGDGSFELFLTPISNRYVLIQSVGNVDGITRDVEVVIEDIYAGSGGKEAPDYSNMEGFNYAMLSGGDFAFRGVGSLIGAPTIPMHSNSEISINGAAKTEISVSSSVEISTGKVSVDGSIIAPEIDVHPKANIAGGSTQADVDPVEIPDIDLTPYFNWAKQHGEVHTGDFSTSTDYTPNGGVLYVIGDVEISSHAVFNGSIIATGNIKLTGQSQINPTTSVFAMASESGDLENTSTGTIKGLVYSKNGNYKQTANGRLEGQIIVGGTIQKGGNSDIVFYQQYIPNPPGVGSTVPTKSLPVIASWQK
jgi:cytoskeletal protein CcmA (bactofilin family)